MSTVKVTTDIDAPPQRVWDTIMDPEQLGQWVTIHRSLDEVSDNPLTNGSKMRQCLAMRGVSFHVQWTLAECNAPHHAVWEGTGPAHSRARIRYDLSGDGDGPTRFEYTNEFTPPGGRLGTIASRVIVGATSEREATKSLNRLKELVERN